MPGHAYQGPLPAISAQEEQVRDNLRRHVQNLAGDIGERNHARLEAYRRAEDYIAETFRGAGYSPRLLQERRIKGGIVHNIEAELMVTDTADFRYGHYHESDDTPDKLNYDRTARVTVGLLQVIIGYARRDAEDAW